MADTEGWKEAWRRIVGEAPPAEAVTEPPPPPPPTTEEEQARELAERRLKSTLVYRPKMTARLSEGLEVKVLRFHVTAIYAGMLEGLPILRPRAEIHANALAWVRKVFGLSELSAKPVLVRPVIYDEDSDRPLLPPFLCAASLQGPRVGNNPDDDMSHLCVAWYTGDADRPVGEMVAGGVPAHFYRQHARDTEI